MRFSGEVDHCIGLRFLKNSAQPFQAAKVCFDETVAGMICHLRQVLQVARIGKRVNIDDFKRWVLDGKADEARSDETRAAGN